MNEEKKWGIDLEGRRMWYAPWPVDEHGNYQDPSEDEIEEIYGISGEAVEETLVYFEQCGGETWRLVEMLNEHIIDERFYVDRETLLNKFRWYNNEYYFYFIMFTKKVIGRYDFHFGEGSDEQLSVYHRPFEQGFLKFVPCESALQQEEAKADRDFLESLHRNSSKLLELINSLLDFSRIEAGRMQMKVQESDFAALLRNCIASVESTAKSKGLSLAFESSYDSMMLYFDSDKVYKIVMNLLSNAMKFTESGGHINVSLKNNEHYCYLEFCDTGFGIPENMVDKIFDRFSQADTSSTRKYEGSGIGLSLVKEFVEMHGGTVSVKSRYIENFPDDCGSIFTVTIPKGMEHFEGREEVEFIKSGESNMLIPDYAFARNEASAEIETPADTGFPDRGDENDSTILIVEDNPDMIVLLQDILGSGYNTITASNGKEALQKLESSEQVDLMLADVMMPEMDGYELTEAVRKKEQFEGLPVILLTAKSDTAMKIEGLEKGATDYVTKPFNPRELTARIHSQMEIKQLRDRLERANLKLYDQLRKMTGAMTDTVSSDSEKKVEKVREFIMENFDSDLSREGLAAAVDMSPDHLSRMFNRIEGKKIGDYINGLRTEEAARLLRETEYHVITISHDML